MKNLDSSNKQLYRLTYNTYFQSIPLDRIQKILDENGFDMVQEDGTPYEGIFCGEKGQALIDLKYRQGTGRCSPSGLPKFRLILNWYKMPSGNYEIVVYASKTLWYLS